MFSLLGIRIDCILGRRGGMKMVKLGVVSNENLFSLLGSCDMFFGNMNR